MPAAISGSRHRIRGSRARRPRPRTAPSRRSGSRRPGSAPRSRGTPRPAEHRAPVGGRAQVDVLAALGLAVPAAQHVDGEQHGQHQQQHAEHDRHRVRTERVRVAAGIGAEQRRPAPAARRQRAARRRPARSARAARSALRVRSGWAAGRMFAAVAHFASPNPRSTPATRSFSLARKAPNSSAGRNASSQPLRFSASFHSGESCSAVKAPTSSAAARPRPGPAARRCRASW